MGAGGVALVALLTWALWPRPEPPRSRQYLDVVACLLTDERGISSPEAAMAWSGMQDASLETLARVQYLELDGPQTVDNAKTHLASLVQSKCTMVLAVGEIPQGAVRVSAIRYPAVRFVLVGGPGSDGPNLTSIELSRVAVHDAVTAVVGPELKSEHLRN